MKRLILVLAGTAIGTTLVLSCGGDKASKPTEPAEDTTAPTIVATSPTSNATNVPISTSITATFSEAINSTTVTTTSFTLSSGITGTVVYSDKVATFTPTTSLAAGTQYTATLSTAIKDQSGNPLSSTYSWNFTTVVTPGDSVPPATITDLQILDVTAHYAILSWTMPGDDGMTGTASVYVIKYNTVPIDASNWDASVQYGGSTSLKVAGSIEIDTVKSLEENSEYYFAIRVRDDASNWSRVSNSPAQSTLVGGFPFGIYSDYQVGDANTFISSIDVADIDDDGDPDILVGDGHCHQAVYAGINNGTGMISFSKVLDLYDSNPCNPSTIHTVQVKASKGIASAANYTSIVASYANPDGVHIFENRKGDLDSLVGYIYGPYNSQMDRTPTLLALADMDGDFDTDIVIAGAGSPNIEWLLNDDYGRYFTNGPGTISIIGTPVGIALGDYDLDGYADIAVVASEPPLFYVFATNLFVPVQPLVGQPTSVSVADLDGETGTDLVVTTYDSVYIFLSQAGSFSSHQSFYLPSSGAVCADFDLDGDEDIFVGIANGLYFIKNMGGGQFQRADRLDGYAQIFSPKMIKAADFDLDGDPDILFVTQTGRLYRFTNYWQEEH